jgi:hypothetical protein
VCVFVSVCVCVCVCVGDSPLYDLKWYENVIPNLYLLYQTTVKLIYMTQRRRNRAAAPQIPPPPTHTHTHKYTHFPILSWICPSEENGITNVIIFVV